MSGQLVQKEKIKKIMKFEKIMKKFCKEIGVDKKTLLTIIGGGAKTNNGTLEDNRVDYSSYKVGDGVFHSKDNIKADFAGEGFINTGVAAQFAYNNIVQPLDPETGSFMKIRNNGFKSRNNNSHSLTDNRTQDPQLANAFSGVQGFNSNTINEFPIMLGQRSSTNGAPTNLRNYDPDNLADQKSGVLAISILNDSTMNESINERNRVNLSRDAAGSSIVGTVLSKR